MCSEGESAHPQTSFIQEGMNGFNASEDMDAFVPRCFTGIRNCGLDPELYDRRQRARTDTGCGLAVRLVRPLREAISAEFAYWIVCRKSAADAPKISQFRSWLIGQV
jgi:hypothetical protein